MDRQWRPTPRATQFPGNVCPTCLIPHFPYCPPAPAPPSSTFHPPPPFPYPYFPPHHQHPNTFDSDTDRTFKRPRIDDPFNFSDDERRLKLIRDHGIALSNNPPQEYHHHHSDDRLPPHVRNAQFKTSPYPPHHVPHGAINGSGYHEHIGVANDPNFPFPPQEANNMMNGRVVHNPYPYPYPYPAEIEASRFFRGQPPLPSSPPPPLPIDPPTNHLKTYFSPPKNPPSLFPVTSSYSQVSEPHPLPQHYFHNKLPLPEFSTGFPPEVC